MGCIVTTAFAGACFTHGSARFEYGDECGAIDDEAGPDNVQCCLTYGSALIVQHDASLHVLNMSVPQTCIGARTARSDAAF